MADVQYQAGWYSWFTELRFVPAEYHYIFRMISWFFVTLALAPIIPIVLLVIYDFSLWMWRLAVASNTKPPNAYKLGTGIALGAAASLGDDPAVNGAAKGKST